MDRKKTILIAILINAGLLALLFIVALYREEEDPKSADLSHMLATQEKPTPLFHEMRESQAVQLPTEFSPPSPPLVAVESVVHQLPPLVVQPNPLPPAVQKPVPLSAAAIAVSSSTIIEVTVKKGDTMEKIAKAYHTTIDEVLRLNQLPSTFLRIGQVLKLPTEPSLTHLPAKPKQPLSNPASADAINPEYYVVKVGDNPTRIAEKHRMKVEELLKINHLNEEKARKLKPGDRLRVK